MHEYGLVEVYVDALRRRVREDRASRVLSVRFRRGSTITEDAVRQAWQIATQGTALEGATLEIEAVATRLTCACGDVRVLQADDLVMQLWVCPVCQMVHQVEEAHDLVLLEAVAV
jgi:Zn finger protein HypA/HybF involved in hydrogenase expression